MDLKLPSTDNETRISGVLIALGLAGWLIVSAMLMHGCVGPRVNEGCSSDGKAFVLVPHCATGADAGNAAQ